jgi:pimeloyl-ACP methyl ester carboxylesterase
MRRWLVAPLFLAAVAGLTLDPPPADAQPAKAVAESFNTADGVRLKGLFHKSPNGSKQGDAVVVLLYPPGPEKSMLKGDWDGLIGKLNEAGFHVFRFDWRGHGDSTDITDTLGDGINAYTGFWVNRITGPFNQKYVKGFKANKSPKNDIRVKTDITNPAYFPFYVNDLAAVRVHLDMKNDQSELNTSSIYLVGAGDTATLGILWLAAEWVRPAVAPMFNAGIQYKAVPESNVVAPDPPAGGDIAGAVWLSGSRHAAIPDLAFKDWVANAPKFRDNNKMLFLYGGDDAKAKTEADFFFHKVLVADGDKKHGVAAIDQTFTFPVTKTKLNGINLLGQKLDPQPEAKVLEYLTSRQKDRVSMVRKERKYVTPYYIDITRFGLRPQL